MLRILVTVTACLALVLASAAVSAGASARRTITQPAPPVTASAFPLEPAGTPPADGDGLIPNPATPTGSPIAPPASCTVTFASADDLGGIWSNVQIWHNTVTGLGTTD